MTQAQSPSPSGYLLPEEAHRRLQLARNHLELLSRLAEPRTLKEEAGGAPPIPLGVWSTCLAQLAELITQSLDDARWCTTGNEQVRAARSVT
jgi:hypothetical protein